MQANPMTSGVLDRRSFMQGAARLTFGILAPAIPSPAASQVKATRTVAITPLVTLQRMARSLSLVRRQNSVREPARISQWFWPRNSMLTGPM